MNRRSQAIVGVTLAVIGVGVYALSFAEGESTVRYVSDLHGDPAAHAAGSYTLLGIPQPATVRTAGADGSSQVAPNPAYANATVHAVRWADGEAEYLTVHRLSRNAASDPTEPGLHWTLESTTQRTDRAGEAETTNTTFTTPAYRHVFLVDGFEGDDPVWAVFDGTLREGIQPKPSQLTGSLIQGLPDGALIYEANDITVGCSSKFLPDDVRAEYDRDGDGQTD